MKCRLVWCLIFLCFVKLIPTQGARLKRCFVCRSRGELGDCKDPFRFNETTVELASGVEAVPCAAGWCAKILEGKKDDYAVATQRMCLQRPPGDSQQRCADTIYEYRKVFMCFCRGDLCNTGNKMKPLLVYVLGCLSVGYLMSTTRVL